MITYKEIEQQIENNEINVFGAKECLNIYDINSINHLTCVVIENYIISIASQSTYVELGDIYFIADNSDMNINELIRKNKKATSLYFDLYGQNASVIHIEIEIPEFKDSHYDNYINGMLQNIKKETKNAAEDFDPDCVFDQIYTPSEGMSASSILNELEFDRDNFLNFAEEL